jgi:uncharacterized protein YjbI with pentapeptide repeats
MTQEEIKVILDDHILWLKSSGGEGKCADFRGKDLSNLDFSHCDLRGALFDDAKLVKTCFLDANVEGASFKNSDLWQTNFYAAKLMNADFTRAKFRETNLFLADLRDTNFHGANSEYTRNLANRHLHHLISAKGDERLIKIQGDAILSYHTFSFITIDELKPPVIKLKPQITQDEFDFILKDHALWLEDETKGKRADLSERDLRNLKLAHVHLEGANLSYSRLEGSDLTQIHLTGARLIQTHLEDTMLFHAELSAAVLIGAHLENSNLEYASLLNANLGWAHLENASLPSIDGRYLCLCFAHLEKANVEYACLEGAWLVNAWASNANFKSVNLQSADLRNAHFEGTRFEFASFPLRADNFSFFIDREFAAQWLYYFGSMQCDDKDVLDLQTAALLLAKDYSPIEKETYKPLEIENF